MSGDPAQEYLVDGICEDIITALSRWRWFSVTARNSSFVYKGRAVDMAQVGRELGVRYVLEGSIRAASGRIRVTAQLIEARTGAHVWADSYDRGLDDVFAVQDDITRHVVGAIEPALARSERERAARKTPEQMRAWDHILRGMWHFHQHTEAGSLEAIACFERAIALDPNSADAYAWCARPFLVLSNFRTGDAYDAAVRRGAELARKAIVIDRENALAHYALAMASAFLGEPRSAIEHAQIALSLNPNFASAHAALGMGYRAAGRYEEQLPALAEALRLSPMDTQAFSWHASIGFGLYMLGRFEEAVRSARRAIGKGWYPVCSVVLAASLGQLGDPESAAAVRELVERTGRHTAAEAVSQLANPEQRRRLAEGLVKAGMPPGAAAPVVAPLPPALAALTARERDVLRHVARGSSNAELATALGISEHTAKRHVSNILLKLELPTRSAAATLAGKAGLI
ncbi:MAG: hypothetical protein JOY70_03745 [Acidisphaera sp.]|nr:hypothetical protein [Acidisphaera sp.]MBV9811442.1 hypothetical protein [Acetobacteraceae bacterium]